MSLRKSEVKKLAEKFYAIKPVPGDPLFISLWGSMVEATANVAVPIVWARAFRSACLNGGVWDEDLVRRYDRGN